MARTLLDTRLLARAFESPLLQQQIDLK